MLDTLNELLEQYNTALLTLLEACYNYKEECKADICSTDRDAGYIKERMIKIINKTI